MRQIDHRAKAPVHVLVDQQQANIVKQSRQISLLRICLAR